MTRERQQRPGNGEWTTYYEAFPYFTMEAVRDGCYPRIMEYPGGRDKAIVLVHGLTDSPHFMTAIGQYFYEELNHNVYLPLLHGHGLCEPNGMEGVSLSEWKKNVAFAVRMAAQNARQVSIGGLSTGGTLSFYTAVENRLITGGLLLFSAALDIAGTIGDLKEWLLRSVIANLMDKNKPLIGDNPYRYIHMDIDGAVELAKLIDETDDIIKKARKEALKLPIFAAHSEADTTADIKGIERLQSVTAAGQFHFHRYLKSENISHASLVLKEPVFGLSALSGEQPLEIANPRFEAMMSAIKDWIENLHRDI